MKCKQTSTVGCYITSKQIQPRGGPFAWRSGEVFCLVVQAFALMSIFALDFFFELRRIYFLFLQPVSGIANTWKIDEVLIVLNWLASLKLCKLPVSFLSSLLPTH